MLVEDCAANERLSLRRVRTALAHLRSFFAFSRALDITTDRINVCVRTRREEHAAPAAIKHEQAVLRRAFTRAIKAGHLAVRPAFPAITVHNTRTGFVERAEFEAVRAELPDALQAVATFAYLTGWRKREMLSLRWCDVDLTAGVMRLEPRTKKNVKVGPSPSPRCRTWLRCSGSGWRRQPQSNASRASLCLGYFTETASRSGSTTAPSARLAIAPGSPAASCTTSAARPSATLNARACRARWRCS
jgi:hypothetical protein